MKTPELKSGYWSVDYLKLLANGEAHLSETSLRQCAEYIEAAYKAIDLLESRLAQVELEKNALLAYVPHNCWSCKKEDQRHECKRPCVWEWKGVKDENILTASAIKKAVELLKKGGNGHENA